MEPRSLRAVLVLVVLIAISFSGVAHAEAVAPALVLQAAKSSDGPVTAATPLIGPAVTFSTEGQPRTVFGAGDAIRYAVTVTNPGPSPITMTFTQSARNNIRTIYSYTSTASLPVGVYWAYSDGTVPQDAAGTYQNIETVVIGGVRTERNGSFSVSGGRACMFHASQGALEVKGPLDVGHAGWAVKTSPTLDRWEFGSTENPVDVWTRTGTWSDVLGAFRRPPAVPLLGWPATNNYVDYRCRDWPWIWSNSADAHATAIAQPGRAYNLADDNCLTRSVEVFQAYGMTTLLDARIETPNHYFSSALSDLHEGGPPTLWGSAIRL